MFARMKSAYRLAVAVGLAFALFAMPRAHAAWPPPYPDTNVDYSDTNNDGHNGKRFARSFWFSQSKNSRLICSVAHPINGIQSQVM